MLAFLLLTRLIPGASPASAPEPEVPVFTGGGWRAQRFKSKRHASPGQDVREAAEEQLAAGNESPIQSLAPAPETVAAEVREPAVAARREDIAGGIKAAQASLAANTAMADALAKVSDGIAQMRAKREAEDADDMAALLLILAEV